MEIMVRNSEHGVPDAERVSLPGLLMSLASGGTTRVDLVVEGYVCTLQFPW